MLAELLSAFISPSNIKSLLISSLLSFVTLVGYFTVTGYVIEVIVVPLFFILTALFMCVAALMRKDKAKPGDKP